MPIPFPFLFLQGEKSLLLLEGLTTLFLVHKASENGSGSNGIGGEEGMVSSVLGSLQQLCQTQFTITLWINSGKRTPYSVCIHHTAYISYAVQQLQWRLPPTNLHNMPEYAWKYLSMPAYVSITLLKVIYHLSTLSLPSL
jgi:hypothetical protein